MCRSWLYNFTIFCNNQLSNWQRTMCNNYRKSWLQYAQFLMTITPLKHTHTHTHTRLTALFPGLPWWAGTRKAKAIWISLKQETVSGSGISWAICKSAPRSRQITMPAPHHSVFYRPDALPAAQPTASKHWRHLSEGCKLYIMSARVANKQLATCIMQCRWNIITPQ